MASVTQSLAGRTALATLLPLSLKERYQNKVPDIETVLFTGAYPRIYDKNLDPTDAYDFYTRTYIERDVRALLNVKDLTQFELFLKLCAGRTGQLINLSAISNEVGVQHNTIANWLSVLEASYIIKKIHPYYKNYSKRLVKTPKLYFLDTGLAAFLIGIRHKDQLKTHPLRGELFETLIMSEIIYLKRRGFLFSQRPLFMEERL